MPAIEREIEEALEEGIQIEFLASPAKVIRNGDGTIQKIAVQRFELGEPDESGRRRPVPIEGDVYEMEVDSVVMAVSQAPDWGMLGGKIGEGNWLEVDDWGRTGVEKVWSGGDTLTLGLATISVGQGRKAAECIHTTLRGEKEPFADSRPPIPVDRIKLDFYEAKERAERKLLSAEERLAKPFDEVDLGISQEQALEEVTRCFSCGKCFACENCWMYCQSNCFAKYPEPALGHYYKIKLETCDGCKKCGEECPCGFIDLV
jgi:NADPH-dependent glutamate synthase beta subunit-like oxidoreductase